MSALSRAGWILSAALFTLLTFSLAHVDHVGLAPLSMLAFVTVVCVFRPDAGLEIVAAAVPVASYLLSRAWNDRLGWTEAIVCAAIAGLSIQAAWRRPSRGLPPAIGWPALVFGAFVVSSILASVAAKSLPLGTGFGAAVQTQLTRDYFVDLRTFTGLHTGMALLEGLLLFVLGARAAIGRERALERIAGAAAAGAALAGMMNVARLLQATLRAVASGGDAFLPSLARLSQTVRWNVHYGDFNAAGSYFVMILLMTLGLAAHARSRRWAWAAAAIVVAAALWLTGSRAAYAAGIVSLVLTWTASRPAASRRRRLATFAAVGTALTMVIAVVALAAPQRGNQQSSFSAADVRLEMAKVGGRMIESHPVFGIGLGEFHQRSGEFVTETLYSKFPASLHENAHNNIIQVAAEIGLPGGAAFVWLVAAALLTVARGAARARRALPLLTCAGLAAFVLTWLAGHPLLVPEAATVFWILAGVASGALAVASPRPGMPGVAAVAAICLAIAVTTPMRVRAMLEETDLEHAGIGLSNWRLSPDGIRYREARGHATVFAVAGKGLKVSVNPQADRPVRVELRLDGRLANVVTLSPGRWNDLSLPARPDRGASLYAPLTLQIVGDDQTEIWITKVETLDSTAPAVR